MRDLYPPLKPYRRSRLQVSGLHTIYFEESGNPRGYPVIMFHGGPGSQSKPRHRRYFNPRKYRIVLFDQRGCGKSTPPGEIRENTTWDLVEDIEKLRCHLAIDRWHVFGSSWGSALALAYSEKHPQRVSALILHGIFALTKEEISWLHNSEASRFYPDAWEVYSKSIRSRAPLQKLARRVFSGDGRTRSRAIRDSQFWDGIRMDLAADARHSRKPVSMKETADARVYFHYVRNNAFLKEGQLLRQACRLKNIQGVILQGRFDMICPPLTAWKLHKAWPQAHFHLIGSAGHRIVDKYSIDKVIEYTDRFARHADPQRTAITKRRRH